MTYMSQALLAFDRDQTLDALTPAVKGLQILLKQEGNKRLGLVASQYQQAIILNKSGLPGGELMLQQCQKTMRDAMGEGHPLEAVLRFDLGYMYERSGDLTRAEESFRSCKALVRDTVGEAHPVALRLVVEFAKLFRNRGKTIDAEMEYDSYLTAVRKRFGDDAPIVARTLTAYAEFLRFGNDWDKIDRLTSQAEAIYRKHRARNVGSLRNDLLRAESFSEKVIPRARKECCSRP